MVVHPKTPTDKMPTRRLTTKPTHHQSKSQTNTVFKLDTKFKFAN